MRWNFAGYSRKVYKALKRYYIMEKIKYKEIAINKHKPEYNKKLYIGDVPSHIECNKYEANFKHIGSMDMVLNYNDFIEEVEGLDYNLGQAYQSQKYMHLKLIPIVRIIENEYNICELFLSEEIIRKVYDTDSVHYCVHWSSENKSIGLTFKYFRLVK